MKEKDFFLENDIMVTEKAIKLLRWLVLVFPEIMCSLQLACFSQVSRI